MWAYGDQLEDETLDRLDEWEARMIRGSIGLNGLTAEFVLRRSNASCFGSGLASGTETPEGWE